MQRLAQKKNKTKQNPNPEQPKEVNHNGYQQCPSVEPQLMDLIIQRQPYNFTIFSIAGQIFFMNIASLVYSLPCIHKSHLNCWYLFHCVPLLSQEPLLSPFLLPHILSLNKHPLKKKKSKENLCSPFLFDFPHIAVNHSPNTDGRQTWTLALVAFSQEIFSSIL